MNNLRKVYLPLKNGTARYVQSNASLLDNCVEIRNRNPRNLELMTIARKPKGYHLEIPDHEYWHKLVVTMSVKHLTVEAHHFKNGPVVTVSTHEWALRRQIYRPLHATTFANVGKLFAQRCLESGISSVYCNLNPENSARLTNLLDELKKGGLALEEPPEYINYRSWDRDRMVKPWTIQD